MEDSKPAPSFTKKQAEILKTYIGLVKEKLPSRADLTAAGVSRDQMRAHFGNMDKLAAAANVKYAKKMEKFAAKMAAKDVVKAPHEHADFTKEALGSIIKENDFREGTFFVTAVSPISYLDWSEEDKVRAENGEDIQDAKNLFEPGFAAVQNFLKRAKAELVLMPMPAHVKALQSQPQFYDPKLKEFRDCFVTQFTFNPHLKAIEAYLNPQQANPLTGLKRLRGKNEPGEKRSKTSMIVAHSKQMMDTMPTGNESHPRIVHSTGTISTSSYLENRVGMIADGDHKLGGLIVEVWGDVFWIRQVQFNPKNGSFIDKGTRYHADGTITKERAVAFKMGDIHPGHHHEEALRAIYDLWDEIQPRRIFLEDFFDGTSISHHLQNKAITQAMLPDYFQSLSAEIPMAHAVLKEIWDRAPKDAEIVATASNHPEHVGRWLEEARYIRDRKSPDYELGHRMAVMAFDKLNPLQEMLDPERKMNWTDQNADYFIEGVQMNAHGHLGIGGARGSPAGHEIAYGAAMTAHTHKPTIYHNVFTVGHTTQPRHGYNNGPDNWVLCSGALYEGGHMQLYFIIKGHASRPSKKRKNENRSPA